MSTQYRARLQQLAAAATCLGVFFVGGLTAGAALAGETKKESTPLRRVETKKVCMVNDQVFERDQIPVVVEGKTYYGCCAMCKERLAKDVELRASIDPVSGKKVDKASAVIAASEDGSVIYFESEKNLTRYLEEVEKHQ
ncbi:MAG: hypothetical protein ACRD2T_06115 [Thermoanaerobaculia bacterium]